MHLPGQTVIRPGVRRRVILSGDARRLRKPWRGIFRPPVSWRVEELNVGDRCKLPLRLVPETSCGTLRIRFLPMRPKPSAVIAGNPLAVFSQTLRAVPAPFASPNELPLVRLRKNKSPQDPVVEPRAIRPAHIC